MEPGGAALMRGIYRGKIRWAVPHRVVEATDRRLVLFLREGTPIKGPSNYDAKPYMPYPEQLTRGWEVVDRTWHTHHLLRIVPLGAAHEVNLFWTADWSFVGWYVNLQQPARLHALGYDTFDQQLDIVVAPDRSWRWKDEEEFDDLVAYNVLSGTEHAAVRSEGLRLVDAIERWDPPFSEGWEEWRPPDGWTHADLPVGWDVV
jgi:Protein of unknown function (DUF402)